MKIWVVAAIAVVFANGCALGEKGLYVKRDINYELKQKHVEDCRAISKGQNPTHLPGSTYNSSAMVSQPLAAQAAGGLAVGFVGGWMRAAGNPTVYQNCMSGLGYQFTYLSDEELKKYKFRLSTDEKVQFMQGVYQDIISGKRKAH